jgi:hypothetical protein
MKKFVCVGAAFIWFCDASQGIPFSLIDYLELLDWTSRVLRNGKLGAVGSLEECIASIFTLTPLI